MPAFAHEPGARQKPSGTFDYGRAENRASEQPLARWLRSRRKANRAAQELHGEPVRAEPGQGRANASANVPGLIDQVNAREFCCDSPGSSCPSRWAALVESCGASRLSEGASAHTTAPRTATPGQADGERSTHQHSERRDKIRASAGIRPSPFGITDSARLEPANDALLGERGHRRRRLP